LADCARLAGNSPEFAVEVDCSLDESDGVGLSPVSLQRVVMNLLTNARDACGERGRAQLSAHKVEVDGVSEVRIEVRDSGCGIPPEIRERIFDPYFTTKARDRGTGLGLAMVRALVEEAGGSVQVEALAPGTSFRIALPRHVCHAKAVARPASAPGLVGVRVLVVDDDKLVRRGLVRMLLRSGADVAFAESAGQALEHLECNPCDVVLTDYLMPGMSGLELARELSRRHPELPTVLCSGQIDGKDSAEVGALVKMVLRKPIERPTLVEALSAALSRD
jgi:CheY-like chemotaxis protein